MDPSCCLAEFFLTPSPDHSQPKVIHSYSHEINGRQETVVFGRDFWSEIWLDPDGQEVKGEDFYIYQVAHLDGTVKLIELPIEEKHVPIVFLGAVEGDCRRGYSG